MAYIDAHVHVWTPDTAHYPLASTFKKEDMKPASFTPEELFKHCQPAGVDRINLIQMSFYGFDNRYMLHMIAFYPDAFVGTAIINPFGEDVEGVMAGLAKKGVRAFRTSQNWSKYEGIFTNRSKTSLGRIPDGTSNTLLLGEELGGTDSGRHMYVGAWMGFGGEPTWSGLPRDGQDSLTPPVFDSKHPGVVQFCFADGSVRLLRKGSSWIDWNNWDLANLWPDQYPADWWVFQELAGMRDGGTRDTSPLVID